MWIHDLKQQRCAHLGAVYTKINTQKQPRLQLFLPGALQGCVLRDFGNLILIAKVLVCCFILLYFFSQTAAVSAAKLAKSLATGRVKDGK